jgi:tetratricopeptide (TPR) repeat protein
MNRRLLLREVIKDFVRYSDEFSSDKRLDRITWFNLYNVAQLFNVDEQELLYRRLMISELTSPYLLHMAAGSYYQAKASNTRGGKFASEVAADAWPSIERDYSAASLHFRRAWMLRPDLPHAAGGMSSIANVNPRDEHWSPRDWFELACRAEFDFLPVYSSMKNALLPRWGGSHEEMIEFGIECAATKAFDTPVPYMLTDIFMQIDKETSGGATWENPEYVKILNDFWTDLDTWATENKIDRTSPRLYYQISFNAALQIRNQKYAEAKAILDMVEGDVSPVPMLPIITDPDLAVSSVYTLANPGSEPLIEIEKRFGSSLPRDATAEELDEAIKVFATAGANCQVPKAKLYLAAREHSLTLQKKFLAGDWVDLQFDPELTHWRIQDSVATVESPTSLHLSNLTLGDSVQLAIPRVSFAPPYELHVTMERIRGQKNIDRPAVNVGSISEAIVLGAPGGITFVIDDEPRIAGTYLPNGVQPQTYYLLGLTDKARLGLQIWPDNYQYFVNHYMIPLHPVSEFRANSQLSLGGNVWEVDTGEIRINDVRIRKMKAPSPPAIDASSEEKIEYLTQVIAAEPDNLLSRLHLGELLIENQSFTEAMTQFEAIYNLDPSVVRTHDVMGLTYMESGREEEALQLLLSSLNFNRTDNVLYGVAWIHATAASESLRNGSKALEIASELCEKTQNQDWIYLAAKAAALAELKRFPEAIAILESTTKSVPQEKVSLMQSMLAEFHKNQPWRGKATE